MLGLILPIAQVLILVGVLSLWMLPLWLGLVLTFLITMVVYAMPGYSMIGKLDRYLCLDGRWIFKWSWVWKPGESFYQRRQLGFAFLFALLMVFFWSPEPLNQKTSSKDQVDSHNQNATDAAKRDATAEPSEILKRSLVNDGKIYSWNLKQKSVRVKGSVAPSSDEIHFYRENWIDRLPFEWQNN